jgi:hypothetical protein
MADYQIILKIIINKGVIENDIFIPSNDNLGSIMDSIIFSDFITKDQARDNIDNLSSQLRELIINDQNMNGIFI